MKAVILAAGKGVRMQSDLPKVLHELDGLPLVQHVINSLSASCVDSLCVVVGYKGDSVKAVLGESVSYALQEEQLGTGHAVLQAEDFLSDYDGPVIVTCGDAPLISPSSFKNLSTLYDGVSCKAAVLTMNTDTPTGYGRIVKNECGDVIAIVEEKDASVQQRLITEVNTGTYVFDAKLLIEALKLVGNDNAQGEYYLPDVISYIDKKGFSVKSSVLLDNREGLGINSKEELLKAEKIKNEL